MTKSHLLNTLEIWNSPTKFHGNASPSIKNDKSFMNEEENLKRKKNIESYYSKKNLTNYLNTSSDENTNKKYMQTKKEKNHDYNAENRINFLKSKSNNKKSNL